MKTKLSKAPCPFCGSSEVLIEGKANKHNLFCCNCLARGPVKETAVKAETAWNKRKKSTGDMDNEVSG